MAEEFAAFTITLEGDEEFLARLAWVREMMPDVIHNALFDAGSAVEVQAAKNVYSVFTARTGNLATSIHTEVIGSEYAQVGPTVEYGAIRELGGVVERAWGHVRAVHIGQPYLVPALEELRGSIHDIFADKIDRALEGSG